MNKRSLSRRYTIYIFSVFLSLSLVVSILNSITVKKNEITRMEEQYEHFRESHINMIIKSLWLTDYSDVETQINFISKLEYVSYVKLVDEVKDEYEAGVFTPELTLSYTEDLKYQYKDSQTLIGHIFVYFDYGLIYKTVMSEFLNLFTMLLISSILLSGITSILFNSMVGRHIRSLSDFLIQKQEVVLKNEFRLSRKKRKKDELTSLTSSINKMRDNICEYIAEEKKLRRDLEKETEFRDRLFSIISHDLRGPLNSYCGLTGSLVEDFDKTPPDQKKMIIKELHKSSESLTLLTENLLDWAKSEDFTSNIDPQEFQINKIFTVMQNLFSGMLSEKDQSWRFESSDSLTVYADIKMIETVLRNLLSNAIKFTPIGGKIEIIAFRKENQTVIEVSNTGTGMSPEAIDTFNNGGYVASTRGSGNEKGTGLGLNICAQFVKCNKGQLRIESRQDRGTKVIITLPHS